MYLSSPFSVPEGTGAHTLAGRAGHLQCATGGTKVKGDSQINGLIEHGRCLEGIERGLEVEGTGHPRPYIQISNPDAWESGKANKGASKHTQKSSNYRVIGWVGPLGCHARLFGPGCQHDVGEGGYGFAQAYVIR